MGEQSGADELIEAWRRWRAYNLAAGPGADLVWDDWLRAGSPEESESAAGDALSG